MQLKWKHQFQFAGYYAALEKGFYRDAGLDVEIREHEQKRSPLQVLLEGDAQYAVTGSDILIYRALGDPVVALAAIYQHSAYAFLVRADSGIERIEDLAGRRVMLGTGSQDAALHAALRRAGLLPHQYTKLPSSFDAGSLLRRETDAFNAYITDQGYLLESAGVQPRYLVPKQYDVDFYGDILVTTDAEIRDHPERVRKFRNATLKGWSYALAHPEELIDLILNKFNSQNMTRGHLQYEANASRELIQPLLVQIGHMNPERWRHIQKIFTELEFLETGSDIDGLIYQEHQVTPQWLRWIGDNWLSLAIGLATIFILLLMFLLFEMKRIIHRRTTELAESEKNLRTLIDTEPACVKTLDKNGHLLSMNAAGLSMIEADSFNQVENAEVVDLIDESFRQAFRRLTLNVFKGNSGTLTFSITGLKGKKSWLETHAVPLYDNLGEVTRLLGVTQDVTERLRMEQQIQEKSDFLQRVIDSISDSVIVIDTNYNIQLINQTVRHNLSEFNIDAADLKDYFDLPYCADDLVIQHNRNCPVAQVIETKKQASTVIKLPANNSAAAGRRAEIKASPLLDSTGDLIGVIEVTRDITEHLELLDEVQRQKDDLEYMAHHDPLTHLPNRLLFLDRLEQAISKAHRAGTLVGVLFVDLDRFKEINDSLGHAYGDKVLEEVAQRFYVSIREDDTLARLGGDEFTFISESLRKPQYAAVMAQKLIACLKQPFEIENHRFFLTASIGISLYPQDGQSAENLLRNADAAMYKAKDEGKNTFQYYTNDMTEQAFERLLLESGLRHALLNDELLLHYQPQFNADNGEIIGIEALVRWQHPELGLIAPTNFIPLAEDTGLIIPLGEQVMMMACRQMSAWRSQGLNPGRVAINLSLKQVASKQLLKTLKLTLKETSCLPEWLELEVTEGILMKDPEEAISILQKIRGMGIELAIDDFGTGYSSLAYLKRFPITRLKIDQSFIRDIPDDPDDRAITRAIVALGKNLNLNVIAEGVENERQQAFLIAEGCHELQGHLFSKPISSDEMTRFLENYSPADLVIQKQSSHELPTV